MGFLSKLLNPKSAIVNPGGALLKKAGINAPDPGGDLIQGIAKQANPSSGGLAPAGPAAGAPGMDPSSGAYGDPNDPAYGSFTQPFDVTQFYNYEDPGYAFRQQQGSQAIQNSAAAGSGALSGSALKDLLTWNQDSASQEYNNAFNRYQTTQGNIFSRLSSIAGLGQNAAAGVGSQGTQLAGNAGQAVANAGAASGAGIVGAGNAIGQGATNYWLYNNPQMWQRPATVGGV
jgi:hypothetical protein